MDKTSSEFKSKMAGRLTPEAELVLSIARAVSFGKRDEIRTFVKSGDLDWGLFKEMLVYHELNPFAYSILKEYSLFLPADLIKTLESTYYFYLHQANYLQQKFLDLYHIFKEKKISFIPIKGVSILEDLYCKLPVRPMVDVDVLVKKEDLPGVAAILEQQGFTKQLEGLKESYWKYKQYHLIFSKQEIGCNPFIIEVHWDIDYPRKKSSLASGMFNRLRNFTILDEEVGLLSVEDTFLVLALHQRHFGKTLTLKYTCDMALLLNKYSLNFDWEYVLKQSRQNNLCSTVLFALYQIKFMSGANNFLPIREELRASFLKRKRIMNFIQANTFLADQNVKCKNIYLKAHFLLYDNWREPIRYLLNIPQEQFAKFYNLAPYDKQTDFLYRLRLPYMFFKTAFRN